MSLFGSWGAYLLWQWLGHAQRRMEAYCCKPPMARTVSQLDTVDDAELAERELGAEL